MKTTIILIFLILLSCMKKNMQGYRIFNLGGSDLTISTDEGTYYAKSTKSVFFVTKGDVNYQFDNADLKVRLIDLKTSPDKHINVWSYQYDFTVKVIGVADSVAISINGRYYKEKMPFNYGINDHSVTSYNIYATPINAKGDIITIVYVNGEVVNHARHINGSGERLSGQINY